jgi:hypothetical protein
MMPSVRKPVALFALLSVMQGSLYAEAPPFDIGEVLARKEILMPEGTAYEATVPDTLDLAEHARLSLNALIGNMDPEQHYGVYQGFQLTKAAPAHPYAITWNITVKNARTIPTLRVMTGDDYGLTDEYGMLRALLGEIRDDGLMYYPFQCQGPPEGTSYPQTNACLAMALLNRQALDGNPQWQKWIDLLAKGLRDVAIRVDDRAFYPMQAGIDRQGKWHLMNLEGEPPYGRGERPFTYDPLKEPESDALGYEGAARAEANRTLAFLATHYKMRDRRDSLDRADMILRFVLKPGMWDPNSDEKRYPGYEHGIWAGHFHNGTQGLCSLLETALATNSDWLKEFCREGYEHTRRNGIIRMGWFPAWSRPEDKGNHHPVLGELTEPCALGDMIVAAVLLSDAGLGDYWDDVDCIVRNHLVEQQITDLDQMRRITGIAPGTEADQRLQRFRGGFAGCGVTRMHQPTLAGCCTANGAQGFYYAWHGITRFDKGVARVNLFLNRASPWMDVDSYLPYEGKVVLHNKMAQTALVRIPAWLDGDSVKCHVRRAKSADDTVLMPARVGNLLVCEKLQSGDDVTLEFAVPESDDRYTINGKKYTLRFRANTVVEITPRDGEAESDYRLYLRDRFRETKAPLHRVPRFAARKLVPLGSF